MPHISALGLSLFHSFLCGGARFTALRRPRTEKKRDKALAVGALNQLPFSSAEAVTKRENKLTTHLDDDAF